MVYVFKVLPGQQVSIEQESMYCKSSKLTSGQPVKDNTGLMRVCVQVLLAHLPNIESTCWVFVSPLLHATLYI